MPVIHCGPNANEEHQSVCNGVNDLSQFAHLIEATRDIAINPVCESKRTEEPTSRHNSIIRHQTDIRRQHGQANNRNEIRNSEN